MRRGFTLIELLAVIVILAIIALIAVPIVINIISDSKKGSDEQSVELYLDTAKKLITKQQLSNPNFNPDKCEIKDKGNLESFKNNESLGLIEVEMKGQLPNDGKIIIRNSKFDYINIMLNGKKYYPSGKLVNDADNNKEISVGDKYKYKVNDKDTFNFYVLSLNNDNTVNLIMDRNICNDGTANYTNENNYCRYAWHWRTQEWDDTANYYGPDIAMTELYNGTKGWINVPDMIMNYEDENNSGTNYGYTGIITNPTTKVTTITGKRTAISDYQTFGNLEFPLKARLPKDEEVRAVKCTGSYGSCPSWLMETITYYEVNNDKYSMNNNTESYQNQIYGYWLLDTSNGDSFSARRIYYYGHSGSATVSGASSFGIRPVITVSIFDLGN